MLSYIMLSPAAAAQVQDQGAARACLNSKRKRVKGHAVLEAALLMPWLIFLFIGTFDMGFYCYDLISVENAARVAAEYTATSTYTVSDSSKACTLVLNELANVPNLTGVTGCSSLPLKVTASAVNASDGSAASQVSVQYQSSSFIPIPGVLAGKLTITRVAEMRLRS